MNDEARIDACARALEQSCRESGAWISGDGRIGEADAAALLGFSPGSMANMRAEGKAPSHFKLGGGGHRVSYRLRDLAEWIEARRSEW